MAEQSDLLPARMVHALVYCPRLFWLEYVAGLFEENEHVVEGQAKHKRVDKPGGAIDAPHDGEDPWHARALWLSSETLGISAKLDLVEQSEDGSVIPVDTKKGSAPSEGLWPADEVQLTLQALLLREHGYRCERVGVYYAKTRRRVFVDLTDERIARAREAVAEARRVQALEAPPSPLEDSPKCPGCSLHAVCQPDEVTVLHRIARGGAAPSEERPLRRVVPPQDDARPLLVLRSSSRVGKKADALVITDRDEEVPAQEVGLGQVLSVAVFGHAIISTPALHACLERDIPVSFFTSGGYHLGRVAGSEHGAVHARRAQYRAEGTEAALAIARVLVADKIANTRTLLRRNLDDEEKDDAQGELPRLARLVDAAALAESAGALLAVEGEAAKRSWALFSRLIARDEPAFEMKGRSRRPPRDRTNAMISFLSGLLVRDCAQAVANAGLDALMGVFHTAQHGRPALALDLMEPFRPLLMDSVALQLVRRGEVTPAGFVSTGPAVVMTAETRRTLVAAYERRVSELVTHPVFGYRVSYRQVLTIHARLLARALTKEIPALPAFRTR